MPGDNINGRATPCHREEGGADTPLGQKMEQIMQKVKIRYATRREAADHENVNPYGLKLSLSGDVATVANWIDEHLECFDATMAGIQYVQGSGVESIKRALLKGGVQIFGNVAFFITLS